MGIYQYPPNLFLARDYNIGTTRYYNVPYREHTQSRNIPYKTHYVKL